MSIDVQHMLAFFLSKKGDRYTQDLAQRKGPNQFDCSGLLYAALHDAGVNIPASEAVADREAVWLSKQPGVQTIKNAADIQPGDVLFFSGADPRPSQFGPIGHVGMAANKTQLISAYDHAEGVALTPISQDNFTVGMRLGKATGVNENNPIGSQGGGIFSWPGEITDFFGEAQKAVHAALWIVTPSNWVRIVAFLVGFGLLLFAVHAFIAAGKGEPIVKLPETIPIPIPL